MVLTKPLTHSIGQHIITLQYSQEDIIVTYKLQPQFKSIIWGGDTLNNKWNKAYSSNIAESWELSFLPDNNSTVGGVDISQLVCKEQWGSNCQQYSSFPILIKLIDAQDNLSVQVHPSDAYAQRYENGQYGKSEMWYILDCQPDAYIYLGFNQDIDKDTFATAIADGSIVDYLNKVYVNKGDSYYIESGTVHAIGAGVTLYEVQQSSNLTYRVYDYNRLDNGKARQLHIDKAMQVSNLNRYNVVVNRSQLLAKCKYFCATLYNGSQTIVDSNSYKAITVLDGNGTVNNIPIRKGDTVFVTCDQDALISKDMQCICVTTPPPTTDNSK